MTPDQARRNALTAGAFTAVAGPALIAAPVRISTMAGVRDPRLLRLVGLTDVVLAPGLLLAPTSWHWLAARAVANVAVGSMLVREPGWTARGTGVALLALAFVDGRSATTLREVSLPRD